MNNGSGQIYGSTPSALLKSRRISRVSRCFQVCRFGGKVERQRAMKVPYAYNDHTWVGFDDPTSIRIKVSRVTICKTEQCRAKDDRRSIIIISSF